MESDIKRQHSLALCPWPSVETSQGNSFTFIDAVALQLYNPNIMSITSYCQNDQ